MKHILFHAFTLSRDVAERGQCDCDCDCACVSAPSSSVAQMTTSARWRRTENLYVLPLSSEYKIFKSPLSGELAILDSLANDILNRFDSPLSIDKVSRSEIPNSQTVGIARQLAALGFLVTEDDCACASRNEACNSASPVISNLTSWLHLTDRCNLRCDYCYLPHVRDDMSSETAHAAVDAIFRSAEINDFKQVKLKYAGGEPLLRYPLVLELHSHAKSLADARGLVLEEVVLSNGTLLTAEMAQTFKTLGIRLMISLDGYGDYHDSHRPYASGRGSFKDVAEAVDLSLANGLVPMISVTISSRTAEGLPKIVAWILGRDLPFSLNFYRENDLSRSHKDMRLDEEKIINGMSAAFKVIEENLPKRSFLGSIVDRANLSFAHVHTCGVGQNYLVFDQNGQVAKCQMQIQQPVTNMRVGDPLAVVRFDQLGIQNLSVEEKEGCKTCEWKYWCAGGCPLETHRATGRYDVKSPNCNIYKVLFPEVLRLEGLRLLKYADDPEIVTQL
jgi:uncharacterized protein